MRQFSVPFAHRYHISLHPSSLPQIVGSSYLIPTLPILPIPRFNNAPFSVLVSYLTCIRSRRLELQQRNQYQQSTTRFGIRLVPLLSLWLRLPFLVSTYLVNLTLLYPTSTHPTLSYPLPYLTPPPTTLPQLIPPPAIPSLTLPQAIPSLTPPHPTPPLPSPPPLPSTLPALLLLVNTWVCSYCYNETYH